MTVQVPDRSRDADRVSVRRNAGITVSEDAAELMIRVIDQLDALGRKGGGVLRTEVVRLRADLAECTAIRKNVRVDANTRNADCAEVLARDRTAVVDTAEAARRLDMTADTVRHHCRKQHLERTKVGRQWLISLASVEDFAQERNA